MKTANSLFGDLAKHQRTILDGDTVREATSIDEWTEFWNSGRHVLAQDQVDHLRVSTVFLGFSSTSAMMGEDPPHIFETIIFDDGDQSSVLHLRIFRTTTRAHSMRLHGAVLALVKAYQESECSTPASPSTPWQ